MEIEKKMLKIWLFFVCLAPPMAPQGDRTMNFTILIFFTIKILHTKMVATCLVVFKKLKHVKMLKHNA